MDKFIRSVFPELADKRLSELNPAQRDDANEEWIRANHAHVRDPVTVAFLLRRIDELRRLVVGFRRLLVMAPDMYQFVQECAAFGDTRARELLKKIDDPSRS